MNKFNKKTQIIDYNELKKKIKMPYMSGEEYHCKQNTKVAYFDSDITVDILTLKSHPEYNIIFIDGNLDVEADIVNGLDFVGIDLVVTGNVTARNLISEINDIVIEGVTTLFGVGIGYYSNGSLQLNQLDTKLFINQDAHLSEIYNSDNIIHYWDKDLDYEEYSDNLKEYIKDELLNFEEDEGDSDEIYVDLNIGNIISYLLEGKSIFKKELSGV